MSTIYKHLAKPLDWREAACGHVMTPKDSLPTQSYANITCPACLAVAKGELGAVGIDMPGRPDGYDEMLRRDQRRQWTIECVGGDTDLGFTDWLREKLGVGTPTPSHTPPRMEDENGLTDGVFIFYGTHSDLGGQMEVVPMLSGNVEFTISSDESQKDGLVFSLSHLDRAHMLRALLHDFHYSPEKGGPADDQD